MQGSVLLHLLLFSGAKVVCFYERKCKKGRMIAQMCQLCAVNVQITAQISSVLCIRKRPGQVFSVKILRNC